MYRREVSLMIFYNTNREILMQDRSSHSKSGEKWGFFGGAIEAGETPEQALIREVKEEMNLELKNNYRFIGVVENTYFNKIQNQDANIKRHVFISSYQGEQYEILEGRGAKWFDLDEAEKLKLVPGDEGAVRLVRENLEVKND